MYTQDGTADGRLLADSKRGGYGGMTAAEVNGCNKVGVQQNSDCRNNCGDSGVTTTDIESQSGLQVDSPQEPRRVSAGVAGFNVCCAPEPSGWKAALKLLACVFAGIVFGWCMEKSRGRWDEAGNDWDVCVRGCL